MIINASSDEKAFLPKKKNFYERFRKDLFVECTRKKFILKKHVKARGVGGNHKREEIALRHEKLMIVSLEIYDPLFHSQL